jgi:hypothetical protein
MIKSVKQMKIMPSMMTYLMFDEFNLDDDVSNKDEANTDSDE